MNEWAWVPATGIEYWNPAYRLLVATNPPRKAYLEAVRAPLGPWARRSPNSTQVTFGPAARNMREAFVQTKLAKFKRLRIGVSNNCSSANGPSSVSKGSFGKTI